MVTTRMVTHARRVVSCRPPSFHSRWLIGFTRLRSGVRVALRPLPTSEVRGGSESSDSWMTIGSGASWALFSPAMVPREIARTRHLRGGETHRSACSKWAMTSCRNKSMPGGAVSWPTGRLSSVMADGAQC
jgi:hypothetical protein